MGAPRPPAAAPPRLFLHAALSSLRKGTGTSPWGCGPSAGQGALRDGAVPGGARACGRGSRSAPAPAALRRDWSGGGGGGGPGEDTALQLLRPHLPIPPPSPSKAQQRRSPSLSALHHISSSFSAAPAHPLARGDRGAMRVVRLEAAQRPHQSLGVGGAASPLAEGLWGKSRHPRHRGKGMGRDGCGAQAGPG